MKTHTALRLLTLLTLLGAPQARGQAPPVEQFLAAGKLKEAEAALSAQLRARTDDHQARFGLGVVKLLGGLERLSQRLYRYGLRNQGGAVFQLIPLPENPNPQAITYEAARKLVQQFDDDLASAEAALAQVKDDDVKLPLHVAMIRLDIRGDGNPTEDESLGGLFARLSRRANFTPDSLKDFYISFDAGDVHWLRGYCHLLMCACDMALAHDEQELFNRTAHVFFARPQTPYPFLQGGRRVFDYDGVDVVDAIAFIHLLHLPIKEPGRMASAREHLKQMTQQSRQSWKLILAETDDDHEWIPSPRQHGVIPNAAVTQEMIDSWLKFLDEFDELLEGKRLIPFWRGETRETGINLKRVFTEPREFDLVLWVQGSGAAPFLEKGPLTRKDVWEQLERVFTGNLPGYLAWFN